MVSKTALAMGIPISQNYLREHALHRYSTEGFVNPGIAEEVVAISR